MHSFIHSQEQYKEMIFIRILNKCPSTVLSRSIAQERDKSGCQRFFYMAYYTEIRDNFKQGFQGVSLKEGINKQESIGES